ncbi:DUF748 domain-containing protein [Rhodanobacter sp. C03]|uniref:DUF748 domain-containing protein n=1 Tax=Rhodanobacter sp. C03 TaxID=1945858 RepID=UPI000985F64F|nr:DUF748 domain-containing protein [Rhodanobacter sp. C03]OOG56624.1 hypothetical protein B0E48_10950 [Rhodanobacter sp. C03]
MADRSPSHNELLAAGRERARAVYHSHRLRKSMLILGVLLLIFGLLGFFAAPPLIKSQLQSRLGAVLDRPVTVGEVHLNPFTLKLALDRLHIGERDSKSPFVDIDQIVVNASWTSLFRMAPVLDELRLQHPQFHLTRTAPQQFNFSDLIERFAGKPADPNAAPARFALSNISMHDGSIVFDDKVLNSSHRIDQLELGIPFIANLPHDTDVFVQPLLAMQVDGSPLRIGGQTKPFADSRESAIDFKIDHLDLPRYLSYVPTPLPVAIPSGQLSGQLKLDFIDRNATQQMKLSGNLQLDNFALNTHDGSPIVALGRLNATLADVEPLISRYDFDAITLDKTTLHYTSLAGGHSNLDALTGSGKTPEKPASPATDARIATLTIQDGQIDYADLSSHTPARLSLENLHGTIRGFATLGATPSKIDLSAGLTGGTLHINGALAMSASRFTGNVALNGVGLPPLIAMAPPMLNAQVSHGSLDASGQLVADWNKAFNLQLDASKLAVNDFVLQQHSRTPIAWKALNANITHLDLASSHASLGNLSLQGLKIDAERYRNGRIDLTDLVKSSPPHHATGKQPAAPAWHWSIAHLGIEGSSFAYRDAAAVNKAGRITVNADKFSIDGLSDNMHQPLKLDLAGGIDKGKYHVTGSVRPEPLNADLRVTATRLNVAPLQSMVKVPLNVHLNSALLSLNGHLRYRDHKPDPLLSYQGQLTLGRVNVLDNVTNDDFLRWNSLTATGLNVRSGEGAPQISVGGLALDNFYARVIVNSNGRINLQDVVASPQTAPVSVTQANNAPAAPKAPELAAVNPATSSTAAPSPAASSAAPPAVIHIGQIVLARGNLNYTDNFIKPNYTANITQLAGKIGAFGTTSGGAPAPLTLEGQLDDNAPVNIDGTINPLTPTAFLDVKGKADGVELTHLTPYSSKYTGYPIIKGRLTMDVHYALDQGKLNADNHIFLSQLTFGDRVEGAGISHLPVKLAVALLKDSDGNIDVDVPVTGSLSDPQFSLGKLIWHAFVNLIGRAITSPFRLIASAMGGSHQDLGYVEFAPGSNVLDAEAQERLTQIVKILTEKTSLNLDIIGRVDPQFDENGLRKVMTQQLVMHEMVKDQGGDENDVSALSKLSPDIYNKYLTKAYKHAKFSKPRDLIGLTKSQPPDVMEKLLQTNVPVDQDALRHLAERRADTVRQWLHGKVDDKRVFVSAPKLDAKGIDDKGKTTRADFGMH